VIFKKIALFLGGFIMKTKRLLAAFLSLVMMVSVVATASFATAEDDPDAKPVSGWTQVIRNGTGGYTNDPFTPKVTKTIDEEFYAPVTAYNFSYKGPVNNWQSMQVTAWVNDTQGYTSLKQFDGLCFFLNVAEENVFDLSLRISNAVGTKLYGKSLTVLEKGTDQFIYIPWGEFQLDGTPDDTYPQFLDTEHMNECAPYGLAIELMAAKWNNTPTYEPPMEFTISDIYGYKTNGSDNPDEFTFYIPHDTSVNNLPGYFADRIPDDAVVEEVKAAYDAAEAAAQKSATEATEADVETIQKFLDAYDAANTGTKNVLAEKYQITKDPNADTDSWYRLDAKRQEFADEIAYRDSLQDQQNTTQAPVTQAPVTQAPATVAPVTQAPTTVKKATVKKPYKVKGVKLKAGKKRVTVTFKKAKNAKKYIVKYSTKKNMKKAKTVTTKKLKVTIKKLQSKKRIYVQVQAVNGSVKGKISSRVSVKVK
jgi:hypothetical protein